MTLSRQPGTLLLLLSLSAALLGCRPQTREDLSLRVLSPAAFTVGQEEPLTLSVSSARGRLDPASVRAQADMTHPGMTTLPLRVTSLGGERYRLDGLRPGMAGDWVLSVTARAEYGPDPLSGAWPFAVAP